jgi:hypothetical protein
MNPEAPFMMELSVDLAFAGAVFLCAQVFVPGAK